MHERWLTRADKANSLLVTPIVKYDVFIPPTPYLTRNKTHLLYLTAALYDTFEWSKVSEQAIRLICYLSIFQILPREWSITSVYPSHHHSSYHRFSSPVYITQARCPLHYYQPLQPPNYSIHKACVPNTVTRLAIAFIPSTWSYSNTRYK